MRSFQPSSTRFLSAFSKGLLAFAFLSNAHSAAAVLSADQILARTDSIRIPQGDFKVHARVVSSKPGGKEETARYEVLAKGHDRTLIKTLEPASERGTSVLMVDRDLWVFLPQVAKPVRVSLQQRLLGEVSNGDLARMNFVGDYAPSVAESKPAFFKLQLQAKRDDLTYGSIQLWVDKKTYRPLKASFYAASGRLLKVGSYEDFRVLGGAVRPGRLVLSDAVSRGRVSTITYDRITLDDAIPDKVFTKDYLKKLKY